MEEQIKLMAQECKDKLDAITKSLGNSHSPFQLHLSQARVTAALGKMQLELERLLNLKSN